MKFEEKLTVLRKKNGLSQEDLADQLGVSRQAISRWELGSTMPDAPNLLKLSDLFGVSIDYLLHDEYQSEKDVPIVREVQQTMEAKEKGNRKFYLIGCIMWLIAAFSFLMASIDRLNALLLIVVFVDVVLACICLYRYEKSKPKK